MLWNHIPGVKLREVVSEQRPYMVKFTIDGRPAYFRFHHGVLRIAFEDGAGEAISTEVHQDTGPDVVDDIVSSYCIQALRAHARVEALKLVTDVPINPAAACRIVKDCLAHLKETCGFGIAESTGYGSMDPVDERVVVENIEAWATKFEA